MYDGINADHVRFSGSVPLAHGQVPLAPVIGAWVAASARSTGEAE